MRLMFQFFLFWLSYICCWRMRVVASQCKYTSIWVWLCFVCVQHLFWFLLSECARPYGNENIMKPVNVTYKLFSILLHKHKNKQISCLINRLFTYTFCLSLPFATFFFCFVNFFHFIPARDWLTFFRIIFQLSFIS